MAAARRLLVCDGYDRVSIEAIARVANVSRPTVYRRWPSKTHLVFDAVFGSVDIGNALTGSGDFQPDLRQFVRGLLQFWRDPVVAAATMGILADRHRDPQLRIRTQQLLDEKTRTWFGALIRDGIRQGAVDADVDVEMAYNALVSTTLYIAHGLQPDETDDTDAVVTRLCSLLLRGVARRGTQKKG